jgi:single-strand DNA-binding protein
MYNKIIITGNLTRDPDLKYSSKGTAVCKIGIASNQRIAGRDETLFIDATAFGKTAENINNFFKKGRKILIEGRLVFETWTDKNGQKRSKHSVVIETFRFLDGKNQAQTAEKSRTAQSNSGYNNKTQTQNAAYNNAPAQNGAAANYENRNEEDEIPF